MPLKSSRLVIFPLAFTLAACTSVGAGQNPTGDAKVKDRPFAPKGVSLSEFYLVIEECSTTAASLDANRRLTTTTKALEPEVTRCSRKGDLFSCHAQIQIEGRLRDHPAHGPDQYTVDEYTVPPDEARLLRLSNAAGTHDWIILNPVSRTVVTIRLVDGLDSLRSIVCRGIFGTAAEVDRIRKPN